MFCVQSGHAHVVEGMFAVFCLSAMVAVLALPIETKGRSLQVKGCCTWSCDLLQARDLGLQARLCVLTPALLPQAEPEAAPEIAMVPQLQRESPQHSTAYNQAQQVHDWSRMRIVIGVEDSIISLCTSFRHVTPTDCRVLCLWQTSISSLDRCSKWHSHRMAS